MESDIPTYQGGAFKGSLTVQPESETEKPYREIVRMCFADFFPMFDVPFRYGSGWDKRADEGPEQVVVLGHENTLPVTVDDVLHHARAVSRAEPALPVIAMTANAMGTAMLPDGALSESFREPICSVVSPQLAGARPASVRSRCASSTAGSAAGSSGRSA